MSRDLLGAFLDVARGPGVPEPRQLVRVLQLLDRGRQLLEEVADAMPTSGTSSSSASTVTATAVPSTVTVAARPRDMPVFAITNRTGNSKTSARKMPTKTTRKVSPIAANAAATPIAAATTITVRIGTRSSTRFVADGSIRATLVCGPDASSGAGAMSSRPRAG